MIDWIKAIFNYALFMVNDYEFTIGNVFALILLVVAARFAIKGFNEIMKRMLARADWLDEDRAKKMRRAGRWAITGLAFVIAIYAMGLRTVIDAIYNYSLFTVRDKARFTVGNIIVLVVIFLIARFVANLLQLFMRKNMAKRGTADEGREYTIIKLTRYFLYVIAFVVGIESLGMDISLILGGMAALLVGIGFGLQNLFNDFVSGIVLLFEGSLRVGDVIEHDGLVAKVQQIDIRTSKVITRDGNYIIIPNSRLTADNIVNWSHGSKLTRFRIRVGVAYGSDTAKVRDILHNCAMRHPDVSKNREIIVRFEDFGESSLVFELFFWARKTWMVETLKSEIRFEIDRQFRENGVRIPFPQRDLHFRSDLTGYFAENGNPAPRVQKRSEPSDSKESKDSKD